MRIVITLLLTLLFQMSNAQPENENISNGIIFDGEPYLAINPTNSQNLVAAWMSEKLTSGLFLIAIKTRASFDGGKTWSTAITLPHFGTGFGSADVSMAFDKNGLLYLSYIDFRENPDSGSIYVSRSFNGGLAWDAPSEAVGLNDTPGKDAIDRPWLVVDHSNTANAGTLYITCKPVYWIAPPNRNYYKVSTDSGHTWSPIAYVDGGNYLVGPAIQQPMATPATTCNGNFCAIYPSYDLSQNIYPCYYLATSADQGKTLTYNTVYCGTTTPNDTNLKSGYRLETHPTDSNKMVFLFTDSKYGDADIFELSSSNAGQTWSANPLRVNDDSIGNGKDQDMVWGAYNEQGNIIATWRDRRNSTVNGFWNAGYDFYYAVSTDNGKTFSANQKLTSQFVAFDSVIADKGNDFMTCAYKADTLYTVWGDTRNGKLNIYFTKTLVPSNIILGTAQLEGDEPLWKILTNPANATLNISLSDELHGKDISMYNMNGQKIYSATVTGNQMSIDIHALAQGEYFLNIGNEARKFVKE